MDAVAQQYAAQGEAPLGLFRQVAAMITAGHLLHLFFTAVLKPLPPDTLFVGVARRDIFAVIPHRRLLTLAKRLEDRHEEAQ